MNNKLAATKVREAVDILVQLGLPHGQQNARTAYCLLTLLDIKPESDWASAASPLIGITPMMTFARVSYGKKYAPNTRETFRHFSMHQMVLAGVAVYNPDKPDRPTNSPQAVYQISPAALSLIRTYGSDQWGDELRAFLANKASLAERYARTREMDKVEVSYNRSHPIRLSPGEHSELIRAIIDEMASRFLPGAVLLYVGDTGEKWGFYDEATAQAVNLSVETHGKMPDVIFWCADRQWLVLVEAATSHGPVDGKRYEELKELFASAAGKKVYISAFPNRRTFARFSPDIAWESEVWIADSPTHMVHFNGSKFLGPYTDSPPTEKPCVRGKECGHDCDR